MPHRFFVIAGAVLAWVTAVQAAAKPNVVMLVADNLGYGDLGCYGNDRILTPNLDRLAQEGVRCTDFYSASPTCTVSRASLLTGRYPQRNGLTWQLGVEENRTGIGLRHSERLLPDYLKHQHYATACFGKWNIGFAPGSRPTERGFDEFFGHRSGNMDYYTHVYNGQNDLVRGTELVTVEGYSTDLFADAACDFIRRHVEKAFFLYVPFNAPHYPNPRNKPPGESAIWQAPEEAFRRYGRSPDTTDEPQRYQAVVSALDDGVGRILRQLRESGLESETVVIFFSDNGAFMRQGAGLGCASNGPLRTEGLVLYEGNIRVPCIVRWPGRFEPGRVCREPLVHMDFFVMALKAAGGELPEDRTIDGRDPIATLAGKAPSPHETICFEYRGASAVRSGRYKLLRTDRDEPWRLFDLAGDIGETRDRAAEQPDVAARLKQQFEKWSATVTDP